jgi:hypothetical protein
MLSIPCLLYWPHQQQTCWHRTALDGNNTVLVDEDLKATHSQLTTVGTPMYIHQSLPVTARPA